MNAFRTTLTFVVLASLAMTAAANRTHKQHRARAKPGPDATLIQPPGGLGPMVGTWTLRNGEKPRTDIKMVFRPNGTFAFVGPNWQSAGKFRVQEHKLSLEWTSVDGEKVAPGTVKKDYSMSDDDASFTIDKYIYYKRQR